MKTLKNDFKAISKNLVSLSKQVDKLAKQVEKLQAAPKPKPKPKAKTAAKKTAAKKAAPKKAAPKKKAPARKVKKAAKGSTVLDAVFDAIKRSKKGVTIAALRAKTALDARQLSNALYKLAKKGQIKSVSRGVYAKK